MAVLLESRPSLHEKRLKELMCGDAHFPTCKTHDDARTQSVGSLGRRKSSPRRLGGINLLTSWIKAFIDSDHAVSWVSLPQSLSLPPFLRHHCNPPHHRTSDMVSRHLFGETLNAMPSKTLQHLPATLPVGYRPCLFDMTQVM